MSAPRTLKRRAEDEAISELSLQPGQKLPALLFTDYKLTRAVVVESVSENRRAVALVGRRGPQMVRFPCVTPLQIKHAIARAAERTAHKVTV